MERQHGCCRVKPPNLRFPGGSETQVRATHALNQDQVLPVRHSQQAKLHTAAGGGAVLQNYCRAVADVEQCPDERRPLWVGTSHASQRRASCVGGAMDRQLCKYNSLKCHHERHTSAAALHRQQRPPRIVHTPGCHGAGQGTRSDTHGAGAKGNGVMAGLERFVVRCVVQGGNISR